MTSLVRRRHRPLVRRAVPDVDRLFRDFWIEPFAFLPTARATRDELKWAPQVDLYETDEELVAKVELPGVGKDDVELVREDGHLLIRAERKKDEEVEEDGYYRRERSHGHFERLIHLPVPVDEEKITARFEDGILEVRAPKAQPEPEGHKLEIA